LALLHTLTHQLRNPLFFLGQFPPHPPGAPLRRTIAFVGAAFRLR
jgi:hypothetical protein